MNFSRRAFASIKRNIGKTLLLFLLITILGSVISGAISANQATQTTERHLRNSMLPVALIEGDWEYIDELAAQGERITMFLSPEIIRQVGALPYVSNFDYSTQMQLYGRELVPYEPEMDVNVMGGGFGVHPAFGLQLIVKGVQDPDVFDIQEGVIELVDGRVFTPTEINNLTNVVLISQNFAELNNLHVGSTISLRNIVVDWVNVGGNAMEDDVVVEESYDVEIIGIFNPLINPDTGDSFIDKMVLQEFENRIYTSNLFIETAGRFSLEGYWELSREELEEFGITEDEYFAGAYYHNIFVLNDPDDLEPFREAALEILPRQLTISVADNDFQDIEAALTSIGQLTFRILWVSVAAAILILTLLIMLFLRDRQREIGIYLALGEKKSKITSQIILEIMLISFVAIVVALFIGNIIAGNMSETMLLNDLAVRQESGEGFMWDSFAFLGFSNDVPVETIIASYNVSLTPMTILMFLGVGLGTTFLATIAPIIYITRLNPKKIMM